MAGFLYASRLQGLSDDQIEVPFQVADPLVKCSDELQMKVGCTTLFVAQWKLKNPDTDIENWTMDDIFLKFTFTEVASQEMLMLGGSAVSSYFLAKIFQLMYEINCYINISPEKEDMVNEKLKLIEKYLKKINKTN